MERSRMTADTHAVGALSGVVVILLVDYLAKHRAWAWLRMVQGAAVLKDTSGLLFGKVMGSGHGGGFGLRPSSSHQGLVCLFENEASAIAFTESTVVSSSIERAREHWLARLAITSARGQWDQQPWGVTRRESLENPQDYDALTNSAGPVAALTRGSIRPAKALSFWRYAPPAQADLKTAPGCQLSMGLGEAPLVRQCTFSLWDDADQMVAYARSGAHQQAITAAYKNDYFAESMFLRMRVLAMEGNWQGRSFGARQEMAHA
jgi:spheroidene monooxygenase